MLVLSRRIGQRIIINNETVVEIVEVRSNKVRLGITAPKNVSVHREEVQKRINMDKSTSKLKKLVTKRKSSNG